MAEHIPAILRRAKREGHVVFTGANYDLNIIALRTASRKAGVYDDHLFVVYKDSSSDWRIRHYEITTDPGIYWLDHPMRVSGTAILKAGQYRGAYKIAKHRGKYDALCQRKPVSVWRDANRDDFLDHDPDSVETGLFGINIHRSSAWKDAHDLRGEKSDQVYKNSAGCQVFANPDDFKEFMGLCDKQIEHHPSWTSFTYTLLED